MNSLYGNFRQEKFTDIYKSLEEFLQDYNSNGIPAKLSQENISTLYYLLYSYYGNSIVASSDTNRFKYQLFTIIFSYGPTWVKRLEIQEKLRQLNDAQIQLGTTQISNHAYHPGEKPTTQTLEELAGIDEQHVTKYKKDPLSSYALLWNLLDTDVTIEFLNKFKSLFLKIVLPELPLWYVSEKEENI